MRRYLSLMMWFCVAAVFACAGGSTARLQTPSGSVAAMNEIEKGNGWYQKGCYQRSLEHFFKAHELFSISDQPAGVAMSMNNIGNVYKAIGDHESAVQFFNEAFDIYMNCASNEGALQSLSNHAAVLIEIDKLDDAARVIGRANALVADSARPFGPLVRNQGILLLKKGEYGLAEKLLKTALEHTDPASLPEIAAANFALGKLMAQTNRFDQAIGFYETALEDDRASSYYKGIADDLAAIGSVYSSKGENGRAFIFFSRAVKVYALIQNKKMVTETTALLADASIKSGLNLDLTDFFVKRWLAGEILEKPCD